MTVNIVNVIDELAIGSSEPSEHVFKITVFIS